MIKIIPVASGKGGVGKSSISSNLGICLSKLGKTTVLVDLDLGGSNLHTFLGERNPERGLGSFIAQWDNNRSLENLIRETRVPRLFLIPGDSLIPGTANLPFYIKKKILNDLSQLVADYVILDLGSGTSFNVLDFFLASQTGLVVIAPETTSILNAYSLIKGALFRQLYLSFPGKSQERQVLKDFFSHKLEGSGTNLKSIVKDMEGINPASALKLHHIMSRFYPRVILNQGRTDYDLKLGMKLREIVTRNLQIDMEYFAYLPYDDRIRLSILKRNPLSLSVPQAPFVEVLMQMAQKIIKMPKEPLQRYYEDEDIQELQQIQSLLGQSL
ncbi:P-loop NTPase [Spirochaeta cellobiosiphila]|uniref:P-loop NTPase n=1 Tax=Spirochaeta cellobiosiphila TaxID=504483 RepID=UPI0003F7AEC0|nr:P-loop NTPase [Spirochaeta cellobiosiphila]